MKIPRAVVPLLRTAIKPFSFSVPITVKNQKFKTPFIRGIGYGNIKIAEPWMLNLLERLILIHPGSGLLDVGVNIGQTLLKFKSISPSGLYYGFEPNPFCVSFVQELININHFGSCSVFPAALSDKPALLGFDANSAAAADGAMRPNASLQNFKQYIAALVFDDIALENTENISIVKIDVEGAELNVIKGMRRFLQRHRPILICEVLHAHDEAAFANTNRRNAELMAVLRELGYSPSRIIKGPHRIEALEPIQAFPPKLWFGPTSPAECDYLIVPDEKEPQVTRAFLAS